MIATTSIDGVDLDQGEISIRVERMMDLDGGGVACSDGGWGWGRA